MKILITGAWTDALSFVNQIEQMGHSVVYMQNESDPLPCKPSDVQAVICNGLFLYHDIKAFSSLRYVQLTSAGYDRVPLEEMKQRGMTVWNAHGVYSIPMAEFVLCGVLQLYKKSRFFQENQAKAKWEKKRDLLELYGKTVTIVGCGSVGTECAKRFGAFGCNVVGVDVALSPNEAYDTQMHFDDLNKCLPSTDVLVLTLPLTKETTYCIDHAQLHALPKGAVVVNLSRGAIIRESALLEALQTHLGGAVLDVFEQEPLGETHPLWQMNNVCLTPHNSFVGDGNEQRLQGIVTKNLSIYTKEVCK